MKQRAVHLVAVRLNGFGSLLQEVTISHLFMGGSADYSSLLPAAKRIEKQASVVSSPQIMSAQKRFKDY